MMIAEQQQGAKTTHMAHNCHQLYLSLYSTTRKDGDQECGSDYRELGYCASNVNIYYIIRVGTHVHG
jgi:hypothetical protein